MLCAAVRCLPAYALDTAEIVIEKLAKARGPIASDLLQQELRQLEIQPD